MICNCSITTESLILLCNFLCLIFPSIFFLFCLLVFHFEFGARAVSARQYIATSLISQVKNDRFYSNWPFTIDRKLAEFCALAQVVQTHATFLQHRLYGQQHSKRLKPKQINAFISTLLIMRINRH